MPIRTPGADHVEGMAKLLEQAGFAETDPRR